MEKYYIIGTDKKAKKDIIASRDEIIKNALDQEAAGIAPLYCFYDHKRKERVTPAGWLVWSTYDRGAGVVYRRHDGQMIIVTGWQGDFAIAL